MQSPEDLLMSFTRQRVEKAAEDECTAVPPPTPLAVAVAKQAAARKQVLNDSTSSYRVIDPDRLATGLAKGSEELVCTVCSYLPLKPLQTPCQHFFCDVDGCPEGWSCSNSTSCPTCRSTVEFPLQPAPRMIQNMIDSLHVRCRWNSSHVVSMAQLQRHETEECEDLPVKCQNKGCTVSTTARGMQVHAATCGWLLVQCPQGCGEMVTRGGLCGHNCSIACSLCGEYVERLDQISHLQMCHNWVEVALQNQALAAKIQEQELAEKKKDMVIDELKGRVEEVEATMAAQLEVISDLAEFVANARKSSNATMAAPVPAVVPAYSDPFDELVETLPEAAPPPPEPKVVTPAPFTAQRLAAAFTFNS